MIIITDDRCTEYSAPGHPERPERIRRTRDHLRAQTVLPLTWEAPLPVTEEAILRAHSPKMLARLAAPGDFDGDTPNHPGIAEHARRSVGGALAALAAARRGEKAFSLLRPPGHHATTDTPMGFCYLNSIAIAVEEARATGVPRVAVFDFDVHHGNGTEDILVNRPGVAFFSIHQAPCYPGTGLGPVGRNCWNFPVPPRLPRPDYRRVLQTALDQLAAFQPDLIGVSAGFDAYARDPLAQETLEAEDFHWLGQALHQLGIPAFSLLEGGYSNDLPELVLAYLQGWNGN